MGPRSPRTACPRRCGRAVILALGVGVLLGGPKSALAEDTSAYERRALAARDRGLPHTVFELAGGIVALPAAEVCPTSRDACSTGEVGIGLALRNIYQFGDFGVGAGVEWGTTLLSDEARGAAELEREHTRRYFHVEGVFRYSFLRLREAEAWVGPTLGLVTVLDSWSVAADRDPINTVKFVGPEALTVGTEGFTVAAVVGGQWFFADNFSLGGMFRYGNWILPFEPKSSPVGDVGSLSGRIDVFELSTTLAYRLAL